MASAFRLLRLLELLQSQPLATGPELAELLGVDRRTVRRDVAALQRIGIPVEGERGVGGGYRLRPGFRLPPLMLTDDEAAATALGLVAARGLGLGDAEHAETALAKIERVLPDRLRARVGALAAAVAFAGPSRGAPPPAASTALALAEAIRRRRRVRISYESFAGEESRRELSPYGLVVHAGAWYLAAHDHDRDALRTFRVDRVRTAALGGRAAPAPDGFDAVAHVTSSLARVPWRFEVDVLLDLPLARARERVSPALAELAEEGGRTRATLRADSLDWAASLLAGLGCAFEIRRPPELKEAVRALGERLVATAAG